MNSSNEPTEGLTMASRTETDESLPRKEEQTPVLKQVLPQQPPRESEAREPPPVQWVIGKELQVGREVDAERGVCLAADGKVSKHHAVLRRRGDGVEIEDLGSKNHTLVNGNPISKSMLRDGAVLRIGNTLFVLRFERTGLHDAPRSELALHERLMGRSAEIRELRHQLSQAARAVDTLLLMGPTGAGKELAAAAVHALSPRSARPFVSVNCAAIPPGVAESAFFGHRRGSFTGADRDHDGYFRQADTGTLFLDEVGELPIEVQAKLLRALQPAELSPTVSGGRSVLRIQPYAGHGEVTVDLRIIAATNVDLQKAVESGRFRADLYQRLCVLPVRFPALSERVEDILWLMHRYLDRDARPGRHRRVSARLGELLLLYTWPGNVREMVNLSRRLLMMAPDDRLLDLDVLPADLREQLARNSRSAGTATEPEPPDPSQQPLTAELLSRLMQENQGIISHVARLLDRSPRQIRRRLEEFGLRSPAQRPGPSRDAQRDGRKRS
jgi:DNA-binding NtrC family response regulator